MKYKFSLIAIMASMLFGCSENNSAEVDSEVSTLPLPPPACKVYYEFFRSGSYYHADITIENTSSTALNGWNLQWTVPSGQTITSHWNATVTQSGSLATAYNTPYNAYIPAGGWEVIGISGSTSNNNKPSSFKLNGKFCQVYLP